MNQLKYLFGILILILLFLIILNKSRIEGIRGWPSIWTTPLYEINEEQEMIWI